MPTNSTFPLVLWKSEIYQTHTGVYVRVNVFIDYFTKDTSIVMESASNVAGPWKEMGAVA